MGDFNPREGLTTEKGLIGTPPNLVEPEKRMLSSMTPTIVVWEGKPVLVVGSPGGRTIINTVLQVILNVIDGPMSIQEAVNLPRFHHQWLPDEIVAEKGRFSAAEKQALEALGHKVRVHSSMSQGCVEAIHVGRKAGPKAKRRLQAGVDPRRPDGGAAGR
jgi:gamma-glutamyltranspeptidase/glutathione hydrolase